MTPGKGLKRTRNCDTRRDADGDAACEGVRSANRARRDAEGKGTDLELLPHRRRLCVRIDGARRWHGPHRVKVDVVVVVVPACARAKCHAKQRPVRDGETSVARKAQKSYEHSQHRFPPVVHAPVRVRETGHPPCEYHRPPRLGVLDVRHHRFVVDLCPRTTALVSHTSRRSTGCFQHVPAGRATDVWLRTARSHGSL